MLWTFRCLHLALYFFVLSTWNGKRKQMISRPWWVIDHFLKLLMIIWALITMQPSDISIIDFQTESGLRIKFKTFLKNFGDAHSNLNQFWTDSISFFWQSNLPLLKKLLGSFELNVNKCHWKYFSVTKCYSQQLAFKWIVIQIKFKSRNATKNIG